MNRIFISLPYTHEDRSVILSRVAAAEAHFIKILKDGNNPVAPIVVGHTLVEKHGVSARFDFWDDYCVSELKTCSQIDVLMLEGWDTSFGVKKEIGIAEANGLIVHYVPVTPIERRPAHRPWSDKEI